MRRLIILSLALTVSLANSQAAQLGGHAAVTFGVTVDGTLPVAAAEVALTLSGEVGSGFFPDASYSATTLASYDAATGGSTLELDEARVTAYLGDFELTAGKLRRAWGSTDGVNPVDLLNPSDMRFPPEASKLAVPMLHGIYYADGMNIELALLPVFVPSTLPGPAWRPTVSPDLPPGITLVGTLPALEHRPEAELSNVQFGVRAGMPLARFDVSATYFRGFRSQPTVSARLEPTATPGQMLLQPILSYDRVNVLGVDFSGVVGDVVLRGEAAYTIADAPAAGGVTPLLLLLGARAEPGTACDEDVVLAAVDRLLDEDTRLDAQDPRGFGPLHLAALHGLLRLTRHLLRAGCNPGLRDALNRTPREVAVMRGFVDVASEFAPPPPGVSMARFLRDRS